MVNADNCIDYQAREEIRLMRQIQETCIKSREREETRLGNSIKELATTNRNLQISVDLLTGGIRAWKFLVPLSMLIIAVLALVSSYFLGGPK